MGPKRKAGARRREAWRKDFSAEKYFWPASRRDDASRAERRKVLTRTFRALGLFLDRQFDRFPIKESYSALSQKSFAEIVELRMAENKAKVKGH